MNTLPLTWLFQCPIVISHWQPPHFYLKGNYFPTNPKSLFLSGCLGIQLLYLELFKILVIKIILTLSVKN